MVNGDADVVACLARLSTAQPGCLATAVDVLACAETRYADPCAADPGPICTLLDACFP